MRRLRDTLGGVWELTALAVASRFRLSNRYWRWRDETAFGSDPAVRPGSIARWRAMLAYGRWVYRMKRR